MLIVHAAFYLFSFILPREPPRPIEVQQTAETYPIWRARWQFHFLINLYVQGTKTAPQNARWKCRSMPFGHVVPMGKLFWQPVGFQSRLTVRASTNTYLWPSIRLNFTSTGQDSMYLGLENCSVLS
jgi:hypothetical protein